MLLDQFEFDLIIGAKCSNPHSILGMHKLSSGNECDSALVVRAYIPNATDCSIINLDNENEEAQLVKCKDSNFI